jgi:hypothetical protein
VQELTTCAKNRVRVFVGDGPCQDDSADHARQRADHLIIGHGIHVYSLRNLATLSSSVVADGSRQSPAGERGATTIEEALRRA